MFPIEHTFASTGLGPDSGLRIGILKRLRVMAANNLWIPDDIGDKESRHAMSEAELIAVLRRLGVPDAAISAARKGNYDGCRKLGTTRSNKQ